MEESGECHRYGNLIYHKRIPFDRALLQWQRCPHSHGGQKQRVCRGRKDCLCFTSTFHLWSRLTKAGSPLCRSPGNVQNEFRAKNKQKRTGKRHKVYAPKQLDNSFKKGRRHRLGSNALPYLLPVSPPTPYHAHFQKQHRQRCLWEMANFPVHSPPIILTICSTCTAC